MPRRFLKWKWVKMRQFRIVYLLVFPIQSSSQTSLTHIRVPSPWPSSKPKVRDTRSDQISDRATNGQRCSNLVCRWNLLDECECIATLFEEKIGHVTWDSSKKLPSAALQMGKQTPLTGFCRRPRRPRSAFRRSKSVESVELRLVEKRRARWTSAGLGSVGSVELGRRLFQMFQMFTWDPRWSTIPMILKTWKN